MAEWGRDVAARFFADYKSDGNFMLRRFADGLEALIAAEMPLLRRR